MVLFYFCILATERVVWQVNMCILQKFEPLPNHYLYWGDALVYFWEMDTITVLQMFWKKEIVYVGTCKTKLYGKSRNGVSFNRLACNRQKETLFLMPYYWDMKGWRATVSCRLDCAIKMELRVVAIKVSRCQHGKQRKVLGSIVLKHFKAYRQGFFLPCHSRRKLVWGTRTVFLRRRLTAPSALLERVELTCESSVGL